MYHSVPDCRNSQRALLGLVGFRYPLPLDWRRLIGLFLQLLSELLDEDLSVPLSPEVLFGYFIHTLCAGTLIAEHLRKRLSNPVFPANQEVQVVEPVVRLCLSLLGETRLSYSDFVRHLLNSLYNRVVVLQHDAGVQWLVEAEVDVTLLEVRPRAKGCRLGSTSGLE